jgi:hypothetical protein
MNTQEEFKNKGYALIKEFIPKNLAKYLYDYLVVTTRAAQLQKTSGGDGQVPESFSAVNGDPAFEALLFHVHHKMEEYTGLELIPTYTYRRLYGRGNILHKHTDRPSCEISATIKLSDSGGYNWPIWMVDTPYELEDGDAVIYRGCDLEHWRDPCEGPTTYILGQVFTHFVDKNGPYTEYAYDRNPLRANVFESLKGGFIQKPMEAVHG